MKPYHLAIALIISCLTPFESARGATTCEGVFSSTSAGSELPPPRPAAPTVRALSFFDYSKLDQGDLSTLRQMQAETQVRLRIYETILRQKKNQWQRSGALFEKFLDRPDDGKPPRERFREDQAFQEQIGLRQSDEAFRQAQADVAQLKSHLGFLQRSIDRHLAGQPSAFSAKLPLDAHVSVAGKDATQLVAEFNQLINAAGFNKADTILRYFDLARQDVVRQYGTDLAGDTTDYQPSDVWSLADVLHKRGLKREDGFYGLPHEDMLDPENPFVMIQLFMSGKRALAVYRRDALEDPNTDYFFFRDPSNKRNALIGIITPSR